MASQSSPVSIDFFASSFILARLPQERELIVSLRASGVAEMYVPILEPYLDRSLRHVDFLSNPLADRRRRSRVLPKLDLKEAKLVLSCTLTFLVLLLLRQGALARWPTRSGVVCAWCYTCRRGWSGRHVVEHT